MASEEFLYTKVEARVEIDGNNMPLEDFSVYYTLNDVPKAGFKIALGRGMSGNDKGKTSSAHGLLENVAPYTPVKIYTKLSTKPKEISDSGIKEGQDQLIFTGFLFTPSESKKRMGVSASLEFEAVGYPSLLGGSTQLVRGLVPGVKLNSGGEGIGVRLGLGKKGLSLSGINALIKDLPDKLDVNNAILDTMFTKIIEMTDAFADSAGGGANYAAEDALNRMITPPGFTGGPLRSQRMLLHMEELKSYYRNLALGTYYANTLWNTWYHGEATLWSVLQQFMAGLMFKFAPAVEEDAIVPVTFGLGGEEWRAYEAKDYWTIRFTPQLRSSAFYAYTTKAAIMLPVMNHPMVQDKLPIGKTIGYYSLDVAKDSPLAGSSVGRTQLISNPPEYLFIQDPGASKSGPGAFPFPNMLDPSIEMEPVNHGKETDLWYDGATGNLMAQAIVHDSVFAHRNCEISGRYRLDIAPGSLIRVDTIGERFVGKKETFYGHALRVVLHCDGNSLGTSVVLGSIRTQNEHDKYTTDVHPLYDQAWRGAMLVPEG